MPNIFDKRFLSRVENVEKLFLDRFGDCKVENWEERLYGKDDF
jgi:hypothetical protein